MELHATTCPLDCPDACALEVEVEDGRVTRIGGRRDHPDTAGFICSKVAGFGRRLDHPSRLLHPMRRSGPKGSGAFERLSWEEAITEIATRLGEVRERWGGEAILPYHYGGSNGLVTDGLLDRLFFARLGASRLAKTLCAAPATAVALGMYGKMPGVAFGDYPRARCIVVWGANPRVSNIHLVPYLRRAKAAGAFVAAIDPRRTFSAADLDLHLPVLPGADLPIALAMIGWWEREGRIERAFLDRNAVGIEPLLAAARAWPLERAAAAAGVEAGEIERLARAYAELAPAVIRVGWGLERNRNGGRAIAAILAMPALVGKLGVRGGGYTLSNSGAYRLDERAVLGDLDWRTRTLNMSQLGRILEDGANGFEPPVKALFVFNANPAATVPDQNAVLRGLAREDLFTVVFDQVTTDTARFADVLLPATTFLEHRDVRGGYGSYAVGGVAPAVAPRGEARSNGAVFGALGRALGFSDPAFAWDDAAAVREVAGALSMEGRRPDPEALLAGRAETYGFAEGGPVQLGDVLPRTRDRKIHLAPEVLGSDPFRWESPDPGFPLALISPASGRRITSTLGELDPTPLELTLHPDDAAPRGIADGDRVRAFNRLGEVVCLARVSAEVRPGVASLPKGAWRRTSFNGGTATALCPDHVGVAGGACFNDARIEVERAEGSTPAR